MKPVLTILFLSVYSVAFSQKVEVLNFAQFEQRLKTPSNNVVIYNFWATWCKPCVMEMPDFDKFANDYADKHVKLVFVSLDFKSQLIKVTQFITDKQFKAKVLLLDAPDQNAWIDKVNPNWGASIPATCVVYGDKAQRAFHEGPMTYDELKQFITPTLKP